jgi:acetyl esterase/lipase
MALPTPIRPAIDFRIVPAVPMDLPPPIPLGAMPEGTPFQWTGLNRERLLRNVVAPVLYPVRPAEGTSNGRAVLVVPGGGYRFVAIENEGIPVAQRLAAQGYTAFVLVYRVHPTPPEDEDFAAWIQKDIAERFGSPLKSEDRRLDHPPAVEDARLAMRWLRDRAAEWNVDPTRIGFLGFSAGAHSGQVLAEVASSDEMPATLALIYGGFQSMRPRAPVPPLFLAQAADDPLFPPDGFDLVHNWRAAGQRVELHLFERGGHGFGLTPRGTTSDRWMDAYLAWLARQ